MTTTYDCLKCQTTGRWTDYSWRGATTRRCPSCKGAKVVDASRWLKQIRATPRATLTREAAISHCAEAIGMDRTGGVAYGKDRIGDCEIPRNGVAGLVVDLEEHGHADVLARFLAAWRQYARPYYVDELAKLVSQVREARARTRGAIAA